jgi:hypothetical protein
MKKVRRRDAIRSAVPGVWSACGAQALSGCPHGARDARRARSPRGHGARSGGLLRQRRRTRPVGSCGEPRRTTQRAVDTAVEALAPGGAEDGRLSRGPAKVAACSGRGRIRCRLEGSVPLGSLCHLVLLRVVGSRTGVSTGLPNRYLPPARRALRGQGETVPPSGDSTEATRINQISSAMFGPVSWWQSRFRDQTEASCDRPPTKSSRPSQASESARADGPRPASRGPNQRGDRRLAASRSFDREEVRLLDHVETRSPHSSRGGPASEQRGRFLPPDRRAHVRLKTAS